MNEFLLLGVVLIAVIYTAWVSRRFGFDSGEAQGWSEGYEDGKKSVMHRLYNKIVHVDINGKLFIQCWHCSGTGTAEKDGVEGECAECDMGNAATSKDQERYEKWEGAKM